LEEKVAPKLDKDSVEALHGFWVEDFGSLENEAS
jgi:hypothetical protein